MAMVTGTGIRLQGNTGAIIEPTAQKTLVFENR